MEIEQDQLLLDVEFVLNKDDSFIRQMAFVSQPDIETVIRDTLKSELKRMLQTLVNEETIKENLINREISEVVMEEAEPVPPPEQPLPPL